MIKSVTIGNELLLNTSDILHEKRYCEIKLLRSNDIKITLKIDDARFESTDNIADCIRLDKIEEKLILISHDVEEEKVVDLEPHAAKYISFAFDNCEQCVDIQVDFLIPKIIRSYKPNINALSDMIGE